MITKGIAESNITILDIYFDCKQKVSLPFFDFVFVRVNLLLKIRFTKRSKFVLISYFVNTFSFRFQIKFTSRTQEKQKETDLKYVGLKRTEEKEEKKSIIVA